MLLVTDVACAGCCVHASRVFASGTMALSTFNRAPLRFFTKHVNSLCLHGMQVWVVPFAALNTDSGAPQVCLFIKTLLPSMICDHIHRNQKSVFCMSQPDAHAVSQ